jgi:hypothetical protein
VVKFIYNKNKQKISKNKNKTFMSEPFYYRLKTSKKGASNRNSNSLKRKIFESRKKMQLVASIVGVYVVAAALIGMVFLNFGKPQAEASESAFISSSLKIMDDKEQYNLGDKIETKITLQNTSLVESINNLGLELKSTRDSVKWESLTIVAGRNQNQVVQAQGDFFQLPVLSSGERIEYLATGYLEKNDLDYVTIIGDLRFINSEGSQEADTNKVFTPINSIGGLTNQLLSLKTEAGVYAPGEEVSFSVSHEKTVENNPIYPQFAGKIYISKVDSKELVNVLDCELNESGFCINNILNLEPGNYSSLFISEDEGSYSQIHNFTVNGGSSKFIPSSQASFEFPFGSNSENGVVPVLAKRVMSLNESPSGEECTFQVIKDGRVVKNFNSKVETERTCFTNIPTAELSGEGIYKVKLANTALEKDVSFLNKSGQLINLQNKTPLLKSGRSVQLEATEIKDGEGENLDDVKVELVIWHPRSGEVETLSFLNGETLKVQDGSFGVSIPSDYFSKGGYYNVFIKVEDGQRSDFLGLAFDGGEVGFSGSGIKVENYNSLKVGDSQIFKLENVVDKSGNLISEGSCQANVYQRDSGANPIRAKGDIKNGTCKIVVGKGAIVKPGPVLVAFSGDGIENPISQSRQFEILPGNVADFGEINLEFLPARMDFANNVIIGPAVDEFGNHTNVYNYTLKISDTSEGSQEIPVEIKKGFAKIELPANVFTDSELKFELLNPNGETVLERIVLVGEDKGKLIIPNFPESINSDDKVEMGVTGLDPDTLKEEILPEVESEEGEEIEESEETNNQEILCSLQLIQSKDKFAEEVMPFAFDKDGCEFNWAINEFRGEENLLLKLQVGNKVYTSLVKQESGEPANLFVVSPQARLDNKNELDISLLTSPITDRNGLAVERGQVRFQYNGKTEEVDIIDGFARLDVPASKVSSGDIRSVLDQRYLEIGLDAKASVTSISKTNDVSIYLGIKDISNSDQTFMVQKASSQLNVNSREIFKFKSETCNAILSSDKGTISSAKSHWQAGTCYVEVGGESGEYNLLLEDNGYTIGDFDFDISSQRQNVIWCKDKPCDLQVLGSIDGMIEAIVYDGESRYKFQSEELDSVIGIQQNGLNPLNKYLVEVKYQDVEGKEISFFNEVSGEYLSE